MSHQICYLIDLPGKQFLRLLDPQYSAANDTSDDLRADEDGCYREVRLPGNDEFFGAELCGAWTLACLRYPYSALLHERVGKVADVVRSVQEWERQLRRLLPKAEVVRVDEILLQSWDGGAEEVLVRGPQDVRRFVRWLETQDPRHWATVPPAAPDRREGQ